MISATDFCRTLREEGYDWFTGVPCSFFQGVFSYADRHPDFPYVIAANEGAAVGLAAGAYLAGRRPAVFLQNSGLGNMVNPLTSLNAIYRIPTLLFVSGRAYGVADEPQHEVMGREMKRLLEVIGVVTLEMPQEREPFRGRLREATQEMLARKIPFAFIVRKGTIEEGVSEPAGDPEYPLARAEAIRVLTEFLDRETLVVATTGHPSRELFTVRDEPSQLYLMGSMGHAVAVGCSLAMERPERKVVVVDGDGSVIMHLGTLSTIGFYRPPNLIHLVLDNESYESTGNQATTSRTTRFDQVAAACGIARNYFATEEKAYREALQASFSTPGPHLIHLKVNRRPAKGLPRITTKHSAPEIAERFWSHLHGRD